MAVRTWPSVSDVLHHGKLRLPGTSRLNKPIIPTLPIPSCLEVSQMSPRTRISAEENMKSRVEWGSLCAASVKDLKTLSSS